MYLATIELKAIYNGRLEDWQNNKLTKKLVDYQTDRIGRLTDWQNWQTDKTGKMTD